jgi:hypothetical protein
MPDAGDGTASEPTSTPDTWTHPGLPVMMVPTMAMTSASVAPQNWAPRVSYQAGRI